ncbi:hypothetical protein HZH66_007408 [Vespula vulgaris]|uniref:Uncharacterized protein n=1 Tax=Vespula vulgaris TaxID=7454 RepID=A0A834JY55_VESVU|nr:hypothetical protein HZH66_007408 [Vespula vulgaris]
MIRFLVELISRAVTLHSTRHVVGTKDREEGSEEEDSEGHEECRARVLRRKKSLKEENNEGHDRFTILCSLFLGIV